MSTELVLYDGTRICTKTGARLLSEEEQAALDEAEDNLEEDDTIANLRAGPTKRQITDVPVDFPEFRVLMCIAACSIWGLKNFDIARILDVDTDTIDRLIASDTYEVLFGDIMHGMSAAMHQTTEGILMLAAPQAAREMEKQLRLKDPDAKRMAAKDILDRTGFKAAEQHRHKIEGDEFVIRVIRDEENVKKVIDL